MTLVAESHHNKFGSAIFIRKDLKVNSISACKQGAFELITVEMHGVAVHSVYKRPTAPLVLPALGHINLPHIVIGDFNRHNTTCGYTTTDDDRNAVEQWEDSYNLTLIHNANLPKSFDSAEWKKMIQPRPHICILKHCRHV